MALLDSEIKRIRYELGYGLLNAGAYPYVGTVFAEFDVIIQQYITAGVVTSSATSVTASSTPALVSLTLASVTGFSAQQRVVVDVDARQEVATVESVGVSSISVLLSLAHSGTYPVTVEGAEQIIRDLLTKLRTIDSKLIASASRAGVRKVDEIEFFGGGGEKSSAASLMSLREYYRDELANALGVVNMRRQRGGSGSSAVELY